MNTSGRNDSPKCPKCHIKDHAISEFHKLTKTKEATIVEKFPTDIRLGQKVKLLRIIKKVELKNKLKKTDELNEQISAMNKEISNLKVKIVTKDGFKRLAE